MNTVLSLTLVYVDTVLGVVSLADSSSSVFYVAAVTLTVAMLVGAVDVVGPATEWPSVSIVTAKVELVSDWCDNDNSV